MSKSHNTISNTIKHSSLYLLLSFCPYLYGKNPIAEWNKPFPKQHLVTRDYQPHQEVTPPTFEYEDLVVFSLRAVIAAFHFDPKTFSQDHKRLEHFFEPHALTQIEQLLYAGTGSGLLDSYIVQQKTCNAITRSPAEIEKKAPHFAQIRLPLVLEDNRTVDVILAIQINHQLKVSDFSVEEPKAPL